MNLEQARVTLRPRGVAELFDLSLRFCTSLAGRLYLQLAAVVLLPCLLVCWAAHATWFAGAWAATWGLAVGLSALARSAFTVAASRLLFEERPRLAGVLAQTLRRLPALLVGLMMYTALLAASALAIVGPVFVAVLYTFLDEAILLEQQGPLRALGRARAVLRRRSGEGATLRLGQSLATAIFILCADQLGHGLVGFVLQLGEPFGELADGGSAYALIGLFLAVPYVATVQFLTYIDGRTRQDGWDIQLRFLGIAAANHEAPP